MPVGAPPTAASACSRSHKTTTHTCPSIVERQCPPANTHFRTCHVSNPHHPSHTPTPVATKPCLAALASHSSSQLRLSLTETHAQAKAPTKLPSTPPGQVSPSWSLLQHDPQHSLISASSGLHPLALSPKRHCLIGTRSTQSPDGSPTYDSYLLTTLRTNQQRLLP